MYDSWTASDTFETNVLRHPSRNHLTRSHNGSARSPRSQSNPFLTIRVMSLLILMLSAATSLAADGVTISFDDEGTQQEASGMDGILVEVVGPNRIKRDNCGLSHHRSESEVGRGRECIDRSQSLGRFFVISSTPQAELSKGVSSAIAALEASSSTELVFSAKASAAGTARVTAFARVGTKSGVEQAIPVSADPPRKLPELQAKEGVFLELVGPERTSVGKTFTFEAVITNNGSKELQNGEFSIHLTKGLKMAKPPEAGSGPLKLEVGEKSAFLCPLSPRRQGFMGSEPRLLRTATSAPTQT